MQDTEITWSIAGWCSRTDAFVLVPYSAVHLKEQLELLGVLKSHMHLLKHAEFVEALGQNSRDIPAWYLPLLCDHMRERSVAFRWANGVHDHEMLMGTFFHGFGARNAIFYSASFSFTRCVSLFEQTQKSISFEMMMEAGPIAAVERFLPICVIGSSSRTCSF